MPRRLHYGRPGSQVIPTGWAAAHAPIVAGTLDCTVEIGPAGQDPAFNEATGQTESAAVTPVYAGPASVGLTAASGMSDADAAEERIDRFTYEVKLPAGTAAAIEPDHVVVVITSPGGDLDGTRLVVSNVQHPGREFSHVLYAARFD